MTASLVAEQPPPQHSRQRILRMLVLIALIGPRLLAWSFAGGLWRDEVHSVNLASQSPDDWFFVLTNDSSPMGWQSLLRVWIAVFGSQDESVRLLGLLIGLSVIPAMWWSMRQFGVTFPWWLMVLLGLDPSLIVFGGEVRGYGLGIVSLLILIGMAWRTLQRPSGWQWGGLILAGVFAVQTSFTNCFLLLATFVACGLVALRRGQWRICLGFASIGLLAAASMLPYALFVFPRFSAVVDAVHDPVPWTHPVHMFLNTYKWGGAIRGVLGAVIGLLSFGGLVRQLTLWASRHPQQSEDDRDLALFLPAFFWIGAIGFWSYMLFLRVGTAQWYHLPWLTLLAVTTQLGLKIWPRDWSLVRVELCFGEEAPLSLKVWQPQSPRSEFLTPELATLAGVLIACMVAPTVCLRLTSVDLIARELNARVGPNDLIVVAPWYPGFTFGRYYRGPAPWINLPNVDRIDHHLAYEDQKMKVMPLPSPIAIQDELETIEKVLKSGGKIWWIGPLKLLPRNASPLLLAGAPDPQYGWSETAYMKSWQQVTIAHMQSLGVIVDEQTPQRSFKVHSNENPPVFLIEAGHAP